MIYVAHGCRNSRLKPNDPNYCNNGWIDKDTHCPNICGSCNYYYSQLDDKLKELNGELLRCPYCGYTGELCNFPDLFWEDCDNTKEINKQYELLEQMWDKGFNIVTCGDCGQVFIHKLMRTNNELSE